MKSHICILIAAPLVASSLACSPPAKEPETPAAHEAQKPAAPAPPPAPPPPPAQPSTLVTVPPAGTTIRAYTMDDLVALEKSRGWRELVSHAQDVPPASRDANWSRLVETAALGVLDADTEPRVGMAHAEELRAHFPPLQSSRTFMVRRNQVGIDAFKKCYEESWSGVDCTEDLVSFVKGDLTESNLAMQAGRLVIRNQFPYVASRFFKMAVTAGPVTHQMCADPDLVRSVAAAFDGLPEDHPIRHDARDVRAACKGK